MPFLWGLSDARGQAQLERLDLRQMSKPQFRLGLQEAEVHLTLLPITFRNLSTI